MSEVRVSFADVVNPTLAGQSNPNLISSVLEEAAKEKGENLKEVLKEVVAELQRTTAENAAVRARLEKQLAELTEYESLLSKCVSDEVMSSDKQFLPLAAALGMKHCVSSQMRGIGILPPECDDAAWSAE